MTDNMQLLTREQAAQYLGVTVGYLENCAREKRPPAYYKIGSRTVRYKQAELDAFLAARQVNQETPTESDAEAR